MTSFSAESEVFRILAKAARIARDCLTPYIKINLQIYFLFNVFSFFSYFLSNNSDSLNDDCIDYCLGSSSLVSCLFAKVLVSFLACQAEYTFQTRSGGELLGSTWLDGTIFITDRAKDAECCSLCTNDGRYVS